MALVMSKSVVCRKGMISRCHCRQSHFIGMQCMHLTPAADTGLISDSTATADLVPATGPTSDSTTVVHSETEEVPAAEMMCLMYVSGEDVLWSATSLDLFSPGDNLYTIGLQMVMVDHQYLGILSSSINLLAVVYTVSYILVF